MRSESGFQTPHSTLLPILPSWYCLCLFSSTCNYRNVRNMGSWVSLPSEDCKSTIDTLSIAYRSSLLTIISLQQWLPRLGPSSVLSLHQLHLHRLHLGRRPSRLLVLNRSQRGHHLRHATNSQGPRLSLATKSARQQLGWPHDHDRPQARYDQNPCSRDQG